VKEIFKKQGFKNVDGDEAFYYLRENNKLSGMILTHVDDFNIAGTKDFVNKVVELLRKELKVSQVERNSFRFTGVDIT
jgi:hypothetical protein